MKITPYYAQQIKVETQNFASHKHGYAIYWSDEIHFVAVSFCSGDARFCVSTGEDSLFVWAMKCLSLLRFLFVRRKILRLYRLTPLLLFMGNCMMVCTANQSRDAKSCVSQACICYLLEWWNAFRCCVFCSGDAKFCVSTGRTTSLFHVKHSEMCGGILHCINMQRYFRKRINIHRQLHESAAGISESIFGDKYASFERFC